jgi:hypothetical protein
MGSLRRSAFFRSTGAVSLCLQPLSFNMASTDGWSVNETELLRVGSLKYGEDVRALSALFADKSPEECKRKLRQINSSSKMQPQSQSQPTNPASSATSSSTTAVSPSSSSSGAAPPGSIIPASGISDTAKLLFVTAKLHARNLLSKEEKRILKQMAIRGEPALLAVDMAGETFLTQLIELASSRAITAAAHTFNEFLFKHCSTNHGKTLSKNERKSKNITDNSYVYGQSSINCRDWLNRSWTGCR